MITALEHSSRKARAINMTGKKGVTPICHPHAAALASLWHSFNFFFFFTFRYWAGMQILALFSTSLPLPSKDMLILFHLAHAVATHCISTHATAIACMWSAMASTKGYVYGLALAHFDQSLEGTSLISQVRDNIPAPQ